MLHFFYFFMLKKTCLKVQNLQHTLWIKNDPPSFFSEIQKFWRDHPSFMPVVTVTLVAILVEMMVMMVVMVVMMVVKSLLDNQFL